jgi:nucleoside-diphosphate kinase
MSIERTLSIIKPDGVAQRNIGKIISRFEEHGFNIIAIKMLRLNRTQAEQFYEVHREKPFYGELVEFMISGPVVVQVLESEDAVARNRQLMGATNPEEAAMGTIRKDFATSIERNVVHGSDSLAAAEQEIAFFFGYAQI